MPQREEVTARESYLLGKHKPASNTAAVVTLTAFPSGRYALHALLISIDGAVGAAVAVSVAGLDDGAGNSVTAEFYIPAATLGPVHLNFNKSLMGRVNTNVVVTLPPLGGGISGLVDVFGAKVGK